MVDKNGHLVKEKLKFRGGFNAVSENGYLSADIPGGSLPTAQANTIILDTQGYNLVGKYQYIFKGSFTSPFTLVSMTKDIDTLKVSDLERINDKVVIPPEKKELFDKVIRIVVEKEGDTSGDSGTPVAGKTVEEDIMVPVTWAKDDAESTADKAVFKGTLQLPENVKNDKNITAKAVFNLTDKPSDDKPGTGGSSSGGTTTKPSDKKPEEKKLPYTISRVAGNDRIATSVDLSKKYYKTADTVVVASGYNYPDALVASSMSSTFKAPILLTKGNKLPDSVKEEIKRLGAKNVYIIGGESAVDSSVQEELAKLGVNVERVSGADRYETSLAVAKLKYPNAKAALVASGQSFPDALAAGGVTKVAQAPIVLTKKTNSAKSTIDYLKTLKELIIVGGVNTINDGQFK